MPASLLREANTNLASSEAGKAYPAVVRLHFVQDDLPSGGDAATDDEHLRVAHTGEYVFPSIPSLRSRLYVLELMDEDTRELIVSFTKESEQASE